jgi:hypothetical protein
MDSKKKRKLTASATASDAPATKDQDSDEDPDEKPYACMLFSDDQGGKIAWWTNDEPTLLFGAYLLFSVNPQLSGTANQSDFDKAFLALPRPMNIHKADRWNSGKLKQMDLAWTYKPMFAVRTSRIPRRIK